MKLLLISCYVVLFKIMSISGLPFEYNPNDFRLRRSPHRTVMVSGYYPSKSNYRPGSATTAFLSGETVATNSYIGGRYRPLQEDEDFDVQSGGANQEHDQQETVPVPSAGAELPEEEIVKPSRIPKRKATKPQPDDEDEDDEESWPLSSRRRGPSYNAFFPIMFGGYGGGDGKGRGGGDGYPGSATAIANSYSTGRGGVASSHATAYGDPYVNTLLRNGNNFKKKQPVQQETF